MSSPDFLRIFSFGPATGRERADPIDWEISKAWQDRAKILADRNLKSSAGSITETIAATRGPAGSLPMYIQLRRLRRQGAWRSRPDCYLIPAHPRVSDGKVWLASSQP
jgi:hypothetical protein